MFPNPSGDGYHLDVQTDLLSDFNTRVVVTLPHIAAEKVFALKGSTAINLFYRDLPWLSVDIDLTYLPIRDRTESFADIHAAMDRLVTSIEKSVAGAKAQRIEGGGGWEAAAGRGHGPCCHN